MEQGAVSCCVLLQGGMFMATGQVIKAESMLKYLPAGLFTGTLSKWVGND